MPPAINRNKVYTVSLLPDDPFEGNTFTSKVTVADWEKDGDYNPGPGTHSGLTLDLEACNFPDNV
ncbi:MAG: hypothetical protein K2K95_03510, partial [Muribaculaceae bacterium]|nr:hypothetical protein [Muribaculaceae bacterium]